MASTIILSDNGASSGSAGLKSTAGNDGVLILQTTTSGGTATNAIYVDNNQNAGFGVTPSAWTTFKAIELGQAGNSIAGYVGGNSTVITSNAYYSTSGTAGYKYGVSGSAALQYAQEGDGTHKWYNANSGTANANISFTQVLAVAKDKSLALQSATSQSGTGITFPATQSASTDANTLDDYEEGTFTPTDGSGAGLSFSIAYGRYIKVGKFVNVWIDVTYPSTANGSNAAISSLPFTAGGGGSNPAFTGSPGYSTASRNMILEINSSTTATVLNMGFSTPVTNAQLSTQRAVFTATYAASA